MTIILLIVLSGNNPLAFANHLYESGDYELALLEYKRYHLQHPKSIFPIIAITECYLKLERYQKTKNSTTELPDHMRNYIIGRANFYEGSFDSAINYLKLSPVKEAQTLAGLSHGHRFRFDSMAYYLDVPPTHVSSRSPLLAGVFGVVPGAGHCYAGRYYDGFHALFFTGIFAAFGYFYLKRDQQTKGTVFLSISGIFWLGNIVGAVNSARDYNLSKKTEYLKSVMKRHPEEKFSPLEIWR